MLWVNQPYEEWLSTLPIRSQTPFLAWAWAGHEQSSSDDDSSQASICYWVGPSVPLQRGSEGGRKTDCNPWTPRLLKVLRPNRSSCVLPDPSNNYLSSSSPVHSRWLPLSALVSLFTLLYSPLPLSLSPLYPLSFLHSSPTTVTSLFPSSLHRHARAITALLSDLFPHRIHYVSPSSFYLHPPIQSIWSPSQPNIHRLLASSISAHHRVP